ncbi:protein MAIN-LIKE 1-like [Glycine max]|uniref:protein MAIN-LIKE 1-like n=1 Tax=Glycine max TaxID=3847 RepID=UPI0003DEB09D|nr:protein MAIN-LIKE 1-like [Glycine max]|eukprot:XP_006582562.1 protein MAIN-LIKE 1-like [Glycine max]
MQEIQKNAIAVVKDVENVDHDTDEPHEEPHDPVTEDVGDGSQGFSGRPQDTPVLTSYVGHVAVNVWVGKERTKLKLASHGRKVEKFGRLALEIEGLVAGTSLSSLITCSLETGDKGLLFAFAERWHKETSSFHLPIREMSITLDDVASLLHLPITGAFHMYDAIDVEHTVDLLVELLEVSRQEAVDETKHDNGH